MSDFIEETKLLGIAGVASLPREVSNLQHTVAMKDYEAVIEKCEYLISLLAVVKEEHIIYLTEKETHNGYKQKQTADNRSNTGTAG